MKRYVTLACMLQACKRHAPNNNTLVEYTNDIMQTAPSGSGFDCGVVLDVESCTPSRLVFITSFHHMNDTGHYDGWTEHTVLVTPTFGSINVDVTGQNRNGIKDYIADTFYTWLNGEDTL